MSAVVILGLGSPAADDRAGWAVAESILAKRALAGFPTGCVRVECLDRPGAALIERMRGGAHVILIDAMRSGAPAGTITRLGASEIDASTQALASTHGFGVAQALALASILDPRPPSLVLFGIEADSLDSCGAMTPTVASAIPKVAEQVMALVSSLLPPERRPHE